LPLTGTNVVDMLITDLAVLPAHPQGFIQAHRAGTGVTADEVAARLPRNTQGMSALDYLRRLEAESIHIFREVVAECEKPVLLYSVGKDSSVMLHLARKAFAPAKPPFPLLQIASGGFSGNAGIPRRHRQEIRLDLLVHTNEEGVRAGILPWTHGAAYSDIMLTRRCARLWTSTASMRLRRRPPRRRKEPRQGARVSFRSSQHRWDPKNQRPELWSLYNARKNRGESIRVFPLSNWTELDVWQYIMCRRSPSCRCIWPSPGRCAARRPPHHGRRRPAAPGRDRRVETLQVRFRTLGDYPLTGATPSTAQDVPAVIGEMLSTKDFGARGTRVDKDGAASMEKRKQEGYF